VHCSSSRPWRVPASPHGSDCISAADRRNRSGGPPGGWWLDYAEHATVLALAGVLAASRGPGCRILRGLCSAVWLYLGLVAALVCCHTMPGRGGRLGGTAGLLVGIGFGFAAGRGSGREVTGTPRRALP
jgi:hypothetical protein